MPCPSLTRLSPWLLACCLLAFAPAWAAEPLATPASETPAKTPGKTPAKTPAKAPAKPAGKSTPAKPATATPAADSESAEARLPLQELRMFVEALDKIRNSYVEPVDDRTLLRHAIQGMLSGLDPHSAFLNADDFRELQDTTTGEFGGLGMEVSMEDGLVRVIAPIDDTPAQRAGIESGDLLVRIDDKPVTGMSLDEAIGMMRGKPGTTIHLSVMREGIDQPLELTLTRAIIQVHSVRQKLLEPGFGYIRIAHFQDNTGQEVEQAIAALQAGKTPLKGLVLDLRNNPGGVLQASVQVADAFLESGLIVYTEGRQADSHMRFEASGTDLTHGLPLIVLINGGSASASEIVAGALQDQHRAVLMGTRSFGKGSVQSVLPLSEKEAIKLTTALYFTPSGRSIQAQGIVPDVIVERARIAKVDANNDLSLTEADLKGHLQNGNGGKDINKKDGQGKAASDTGSKTPSLIESDNQLYEALNLLKGIQILGQKPATAQ